MATSCSHWWHAPIYFAMSITLAAIAITTPMRSKPQNAAIPSTPPIKHLLSLNASRALRTHGFNVVATLLQISPELFLSSPQTTIFAIQDPAISNASVPPWVIKTLLQYHTSPSNLPLQELLNKPQGTCFPTLVRQNNVIITKTNPKNRSVEINNVLISHPDMFLEGPISIHGVAGPFLDFHGLNQDSDVIQSPTCDTNITHLDRRNVVIEWPRIIQLLSSNGFVSFAIGLNSVLDMILQDYADLSSVTIFAPPDLGFVASSSPLLDRSVRFHILPQRFSFRELNSLPEKVTLRTLVADKDVEITANPADTGLLAINGVEITAPDIFSSKKFMIHGISQAFDIKQLPSDFR